MRLALICLILCAGCGEDRPPPPRGVETAGGRGTGTTVEPESSMGEVEAPERSVLESWTVTVPGEAPEEEDEDERDLEAELRAAIGNPASCGSLGERSGRIEIRFTVNLTANGVVSRGRVSGPIPDETSQCLARRLERIRLAGPIEAQAVSTSVILEGEAGTPERTTAVEPPPATALPGAVLINPPSGQEISGPSGQEIAGPTGQMIQAREAQDIAGPSGRPIDGPSGTPIGQ